MQHAALTFFSIKKCKTLVKWVILQCPFWADETLKSE